MAEKGKRKDLLIIIPAYNEGETIENLLDQLEQPEISDIADLVVIDDGSLDNTYYVVKKRRHALITHVYNLGYGSALQSGYKYAVRGGYQYVIQMDADGQHDICNIKELYKTLITPDENGKCPDIVLGSRYMEGSTPFPTGIFKRIAISMFRGIIRLTTGKKVSDPTTGLQGLSRRVVLYYSKFNHFDDQYPDANMLMQMLLLGFRMKEIPAVMHPRTVGVSMHSGLKPILYMFRMAISMWAVWGRVKIFKIDVGVSEEK